MTYSEYSGNTITVRALEHSDLDAYCQQFDLEIRTLLHVSSVHAERIYVKHRLHKKNKEVCFYAIIENSSQRLIGALEIRPVNQFSGQLYIWLNEQYWGKQYAQEAIQLVAPMYFRQTGELFFTAHVDTINKRSYHALKKAGFADKGMRDGPYGKQYILVYRNK